MSKDSFVFYLSQFQAIKTLTNEQLGRLFRAIFEKQLGKEVVLEKDIEIAFNFINNQMVIDNDKYAKRCEINRENGKKGGAPKGNKNAEQQPKQPKQPNGVKNNPNDNDNENDNEYENENDLKKRNIKEKDKVHFADFVTMTNAEYENLISTYGNDFADQCITVLDNYKGSSGRKYKSDYRAILSWVVDTVKKRNQEGNGFKSKHERSREILEREKEKIRRENEQRGSN